MIWDVGGCWFVVLLSLKLRLVLCVEMWCAVRGRDPELLAVGIGGGAAGGIETIADEVDAGIGTGMAENEAES